jgi:hypothetical protein
MVTEETKRDEWTRSMFGDEGGKKYDIARVGGRLRACILQLAALRAQIFYLLKRIFKSWSNLQFLTEED